MKDTETDDTGFRVEAIYSDGYAECRLCWKLVATSNVADVTAEWLWLHDPNMRSTKTFKVPIDLSRIREELPNLKRLQEEYVSPITDAAGVALRVWIDGECHHCSVDGGATHPDLETFYRVWEPIELVVDVALAKLERGSL